jgi:hypothetical protein
VSHTSILETEPSLPAIVPHVELVAAARASGKSIARVGRDMLPTILRSKGRLSMSDYLYYRLWDDNIVPGEAKLAFVGRGIEPLLHGITAETEWVGIFHDKLLNYHVLERAGFPVPETIALYRHGAALPKIRCLPGSAALAQFLRELNKAPWFGKPVTGIRSTGVVRGDAYDQTSDQLILAGGRKVTTDTVVSALSRYSLDGYIFQKVLEPHKELARLTGGRLAGARLIVLIAPGQPPRLLRALLKLPVGQNIADNFWRPGNLVAAVEGETGRVTRVVSGVGHKMEQLDSHPDSGFSLRGTLLPDWQRAVDLCLSASTLFPKIRMQAWDVVLSREGPVLMEANVGGDFNLPQIAHAKGMLTPEFKSFLIDCAAGRGISKVLRKLDLAPRKVSSV